MIAVARPSGTVSTSVVNAGVMDDPDSGGPCVGFVARGDAKKVDFIRSSGRAAVVFRSGWEWATVEGTAPDGCTLDAEGGIWFSDAFGSQVVRVVEGGEVTHRVPTPMPTFACALGGDDGSTLFVLCAMGTHEQDVAGTGSGAIYTMQVDAPHAGLP